MGNDVITTSIDFNSLTQYKKLYAVQKTNGATWTNAPFTDMSCLLIAFHNNLFSIQLVVAYDGSKAYIRANYGAWSAWKKITLT